jgi:hypothetical protein
MAGIMHDVESDAGQYKPSNPEMRIPGISVRCIKSNSRYKPTAAVPAQVI